MWEILWLVALIWLIFLAFGFVATLVWVAYTFVQSWREQRAADVAGLLPESMYFDETIDSDGNVWVTGKDPAPGHGQHESGILDAKPRPPGKVGAHEQKISIPWSDPESDPPGDVAEALERVRTLSNVQLYSTEKEEWLK